MAVVVLPSASRRVFAVAAPILAGEYGRDGRVQELPQSPAILRRRSARPPEGLFCLRMSQVLCGEKLPSLPRFSLRSFTGSRRRLDRPDTCTVRTLPGRKPDTRWIRHCNANDYSFTLQRGSSLPMNASRNMDKFEEVLSETRVCYQGGLWRIGTWVNYHLGIIQFYSKKPSSSFVWRGKENGVGNVVAKNRRSPTIWPAVRNDRMSTLSPPSHLQERRRNLLLALF